jgi:hypothetical protein
VDEATGDGWKLVRHAQRVPYDELADIDAEMPAAEWFWTGLERYCVAGCCGLDAFDFSDRAVRWARGDQMEQPGGDWYRVDDPGDAPKLASDLRNVASGLRERGAEPVKSTRLNAILAATLYADLLDDLARKLTAAN